MRHFIRLTSFGVLSFIFLIALYLSLVTSVAYADGEFETSYKVTYTIDTTGRANVNQEITLKNKTTNSYAEKFELKIGSTKVEDAKAQDSTGPMETSVTFDQNVTTIATKFNQRVIGLEKSFSWNLSYASTELVTKSGQIWEISIPRLANASDINTYETQIYVPKSFGPVAFAVPNPINSTSVGNNHLFTFDKSQLTESGIAISFGEKQIFSLNLDYFLVNNNLTSQFQQIAIPPDNNYQKVVVQNLDPSPINVEVDADGNFLATYKLSPKQELTVTLTGLVEVFSKPFRNIFRPLSDEDRVIYTQSQKFWEKDDAFIKSKGTELKTPRAIYNFVTTYLSYSQERLNSAKIERYGAARAHSEPKDSVCMEFTDLFIAIARAANIPAREVEGYAYTQNERLRPLSLALTQGDVLHAWPEYWDDKLGWVQIDPTWGSTSGGLDYFNKLDFNHITFVQRGVSSQDPYPAGAYKQEADLAKKSVSVSFARELTPPQTQANLKLTIPEKIIAGIPVRVQATVKNVGTSSIIGQTLKLDSALKSSSPTSTNIAILPPYATRISNFNLQTYGFFHKNDEKISLSYNGQSVDKITKITPIYFVIISPGFLASIAIAIVVIFLGLFLYKKFHFQKSSSFFP